MLNVLIVDDHQLFAEGVKSMFVPEDGIQIVEVCLNGNKVPSILEKITVEVILMDMSMPIIDGIETMELIKKSGFDVPVLMLTMHKTIKHIKKALEQGAQGYILKDASKNELMEAIIFTSQRKNYFHSKIHNQVFDYFRGVKQPANGEIKQLSEREREIISLIGKGINSREIGEKLFISEFTVKTHRRNIMHKLNVKNTAELIKLAVENEII